MSFAALRDKRAARREPSASVSKPTPVHDQIQQRPLTTPITAYSDFPNDLLEIRTSATLGRSVYATPSATAEAIRRGSTILCTAPTSAVLSRTTLDEYCSACFLGVHELSVVSAQNGVTQIDASASLNLCGGCRVVRYCSRTCQSSAWPTHQTECKALQRLRTLYEASHPSSRERPWIPEEAVRALGRVCWERRRRRAQKDEKAYWDPIAKLQSNRTLLTPEQREPFAKLAMHLAQYLAAGEPNMADDGAPLQAVDMRTFGFEGASDLMDLVCAFAINTFTLSTPALTPIGVAISPTIALFNHSCAPNAVVVFPEGCPTSVGGKGMKVVLIADVQPGQEILTSYIDVSLPRHLRQRELKERYGFDCVCCICSRYDPAKGRVDPRWCMYHPGCGQAGIITIPDLTGEDAEYGIACGACGKQETLSIMRIRTLVELATHIIDADARGDSTEAHQIPSLVEALLSLQPPSSYPLLPLLRIHALSLTKPEESTALIPQSNAETTLPHIFEAIGTHSLLVKALSEVLPTNHPSLGIALAELGKLLNVHVEGSGTEDVEIYGARIPRATTKRLGLAASTVQRAIEALRVGFGKQGGLVGTEMGWLLEGLEREIQMRAVM
ncbi:hypothetical protein NliqN6_1545 [Naganishia liquefaciens]|uniref:SET domain-containing protein n=1 Tax=Naganishia liquefaciens TaxID=104408 RepID=A0A8H3TQQ2_9TREE|nr:hypothetical protein NliqN6_1545 [Naganishia liquefaciens]